jgi:hypothetical protein
MGHLCKICEKDGQLFATHSFTNLRKIAKFSVIRSERLFGV